MWIGSKVPPSTPIFILLPLPFQLSAAKSVTGFNPSLFQSLTDSHPSELSFNLSAHLVAAVIRPLYYTLQLRKLHHIGIPILTHSGAGSPGLRPTPCARVVVTGDDLPPGKALR